MATSETTNLHLVKPDYDELADIEVINENMDTIDAAVKAVQDSVSQDTGWIDITSGVSYCVKLGVCHLKMSGISIPTPNSQLVVARLPQGARPKTGGTTTQAFFRIGATLCQSWITTDGNIRVDATVSGAGAGFATFPVAQLSVSTCQPAGKYAIYTDMGTGSTAASITAPGDTRITIVYNETAKTLYADVYINGAWKGRKALATWTSQVSVSAISLTWRAVDATATTSSTTAPGGHFSVDVVVNIPSGYIPMGIARLTYSDYGVALGSYNTTNVTASSLTVRAYFENLTNSTLAAGKAVNVRMYFAKVQLSVSQIGTVRQSLPSTVTCASSGWTQLASVELSAGVWLVIAGGQFAANATGHRSIGLSFAASSTPTGRVRAQGPATSGNSTTNISYCIPYTLSSTTTVYSWGGQSSGSTLECTPWLYAVRIA